jgi:ABC-type antimicrobial peptide transport system permease subunit
MLNEIKSIIEDTKLNINKYQIGTLQGITRQAIIKNNIIPNENDEIVQEVINQSYNEIEDIKGGRKKKRTKKRKMNKRKSKKVNKYK